MIKLAREVETSALTGLLEGGLWHTLSALLSVIPLYIHLITPLVVPFISLIVLYPSIPIHTFAFITPLSRS